MAEKSLFFNALNINGDYDRKYNADDISDWFSIVCTTGVLKDGLQVSVGTGLTVNVSIGKATIKGKGYVNNAILNVSVGNAPTGANPYYVPIKLQYNNEQTASGRYIEIVAGDPLTSVPTISNLTQTDTIWELMLGYAIIQPNASVVSQVVDTRGRDVCPWFTAVKGYDDYYDAIVQQFQCVDTMSSTGVTFITNLASNLYNDKYSLVEVYVNGLREDEENYSVNTSNGYISIAFTTAKNVGAEILVILNNFIDGEGLSTALEEYNQWVQDVADLKAANNYTYVCNGLNDNVNISNIVKSFYSVNDYSTLNLKIVGIFGMTAPIRGDGTSSSPYCWLDATKQVTTNRVATLDFTNCSQIRIAKTKNADTDILTGSTSGKYSAFIRGEVVNVIGLNLIFEDTTANTSFKVFPHQGGRIRVEICRIWITSYKASLIAYVGNFINCRCSVANASDDSYCFMPYTIVKVEGGEYYAYTGDNTKKSAIIGQSTTNAISILYGFNAPVVTRSGYYQTNSILQYSGGGEVRCRDMITILTDVIASGVIANTIAINKPNAL